MKAPYERPEIEMADIFNQFSHLLGKQPKEYWKVISAIKNCRTSALGGNLLTCNSCDYRSQSYNSCRNRHCPKCGFTKRSQWIEKQTEELLDCPYFHVVFTVPSELRPLFLRNKEVCYNILFKAASETLKEVSKTKLGAEVGAIGVLHTWSQTLIDHPHVHFIVPGGGLNKDKTKWVQCQQKYLLPVKMLSKVFKGKLLNYVERADQENKLKFMGQIAPLTNPGILKDLLLTCAAKDFIVYAKKPFAGPGAVINYLGQYTHRIAISNHRIVKIEGERVHFKYRDPKNPSKKKMMALHVRDFMLRFLQHVLPKGFVRIRHFGLLGNRYKKEKVDVIRRLLGLEELVTKKAVESWKALLKRLTGVDTDQCPVCDVGKVTQHFSFKSFLSTA